MKRSEKLGVSVLLAGLALSAVGITPVVRADDTSGDISYTTFSGTDRVFKRSYSFIGGTLTYGPQITISSLTDTPLAGADGLIFDPTNTSFLVIGGQNQDFYRLSATTPHGVVQDSGDASPALSASIFHVVADFSGTSAWGSDIPGTHLVNIALTGSGFGASSVSPLISGGDTSITGLAFDGSGTAYYTNAGAGGTGDFGTIIPSTGVTTKLRSAVPAAHGIQFDSFTGDLILFGDSHITQLAPGGATVSDLDLSAAGVVLDQGTVDGKGHLFVASNTGGKMLFLDYSGTSLVGAGTNFLDINSTAFPASLDDVAPLSGKGSQQPSVPEPASLTLFGLGSLAAGFTRRRKSS